MVSQYILTLEARLTAIGMPKRGELRKPRSHTQSWTQRSKGE